MVGSRTLPAHEVPGFRRRRAHPHLRKLSDTYGGGHAKRAPSGWFGPDFGDDFILHHGISCGLGPVTGCHSGE